jgi:hypothetical protein
LDCPIKMKTLTGLLLKFFLLDSVGTGKLCPA